MRIFIVGPMASGKSLVGPGIAEYFKLPFFDSDHEIESKTGVDINWIFEKEGEEGFREREELVIKEISKKESFVLSTGGGAIIRRSNIDLIKKGDHVIYLQTSIRTQIKRTATDERRPLLNNKDNEATLAGLAKIRNPLYEEVASIIIKEKAISLPKLIARIVKMVEKKYEV